MKSSSGTSSIVAYLPPKPIPLPLGPEANLMNFVRLLPVILSLLVLAAHFLRAGLLPLTIMLLVLIALLGMRQPWVARLAQVTLLVGACEWLRTAVYYILARQRADMPWGRLAIILGTVVVVTLASALVFQSRALRERYRLD
jgi:hypothetical protein